MLGGDLDNRVAASVGMRFEQCLRFFGKLNSPGKGFLEQLTNRNSLNIIIITTGDRRKAMAFCMKWAIPYTHVIDAETEFEIPDICREQRLVAYFDSDPKVIEQVIARRGEVQLDAKLWTQFKEL